MAKDKLKKYEYLLERKKRQVKASYFEFFKYFWDTVIFDEYKDNWHIEYLCNEAQKAVQRVIDRKPKLYDLCINIPPGESKSSIFTVFLQAWVWTIDPTICFISSSYSASLSLDHSVKTRDIIKSDKFKEMFGSIEIKRDMDNKGHWSNTQGGSRISTSTGGSITGQHGHIIIDDDPLNPQQAASDVKLETANKHSKTLATRKKDSDVTLTIRVMQRLHVEDPSGIMIRKDNVKHICLPAELNDNVKPAELKEYYVDGLLDPVRMNRSVLKEKAEDLGTYGYAGQMMQSPTALEGNILKANWFGLFDYSEMQGQTVNFKADTAYTKDSNNDYCVIIAYLKHNNCILIKDMYRKRVEFPEFIRDLKNFVSKNGTKSSVIKIEPKATGKSVVQQLRSTTMLNILEDKAPTQDKISRIMAISPLVESGRCKLLAGSHWIENFITECTEFPNSKHDDIPDVLAMIMRDLNFIEYKVVT